MKKADKKKRCGTNYYGLFVIGISWFIIGISTQNMVFTSLGAVFFTIGLINKNQWKKRCGWKDLSKKERRNKILMVIASFLIAFLIGIIAVLLTR